MLIPSDLKKGYFQDVVLNQEPIDPDDDDYLVPRYVDQKNVPMKIIHRSRLNTFLFS